MSTGPVLLLDSASLYYRSFYALPDSMTAPDGRPHNALRGFLTMLDALYRTFEPTGIVACWDTDWRPQWRVDLMPSYKAHRVLEVTAQGDSIEDEPDALGAQVDAIGAILDAAGLARIGIQDYEADDVVASLAAQTPGRIVAVSGDRDLVQVVDDANEVRLLLAVNGGMPKWPLLDEAAVLDRFEVPATAYVDMAILRGDPSDGIPGVPGIGAKTAAALLQRFGTIDAVIAAAGNEPRAPLTARISGLIREHGQALQTARQVAAARKDLVIDVQTALPISPPDPQELSRLVAKWGVERFMPTWLAS